MADGTALLGGGSMDKEKLEKLKKYVTEGREYIEGLKVGDYFDGVWPEAERRGYARGSFEWQWFSNGAIALLPPAINVDKENIIVSPLEY